MNIISVFDYFSILYEVETNGKCCVPLNSVHHNYAIFLSKEEYSKLPKLGFQINKENRDILNFSDKEYRKLICSDRIIRIYSKTNGEIKTIMFALNSSFYTRRLGENMFLELN